MANKVMENIMDGKYHPPTNKFKLGFSIPIQASQFNADGTVFKIDGKPLMRKVKNRRGSYQGRGKSTTV